MTKFLGIPIATAEAAPIWPAYDRLWLKFGQMVRRAGMPVIMLVQVPDAAQLAALGSRDGVLLGWEVSDHVRRERLTARGWDDAAIAGAADDATELRSQVAADRIVHSPDGEDPVSTAQRLLALARDVVSGRK